MNRKIVRLFLILLVFFQAVPVRADEWFDMTRAKYPEASEAYRPKSSIVIDAKTGDVLWEDNADEVRDPASLSKMMTLYLVFEAIAEGKFTLETTVKATEIDQAVSEIYEISNNKITAGVEYTVSELTLATIIPSSNAATLMLARLVEPDHDAFIDKMNAKAQELGMANSKFYNSTGAVASSFQGYYNPQRYDNNLVNQVTVRDYASLVYYFVNKYPDILKYTGQSTVTIKAGTPYEETFTSHNYSLPGMANAFEGMTGFKTGSSPSAGFNLIGTAKRDDQELISVSMGSGDWSDQNGEQGRHPFINTLLEKAFTDYDYKLILEAGEHKISGRKLRLDKPVYATVATNGREPKISYQKGQLQIDNGLSKVSESVAQEQVVKVSEKAAANPDRTKLSKTQQLSGLIGLIGGIVLAVSLALLGLLWLYKGDKNKGSATNGNPSRNRRDQ